MSGTHLQAQESSDFPFTWKRQMYMICEGTGSAVWLMTHGCYGLQIVQWNRQKLLARVSHLSRREVPYRINPLCPPPQNTNTSPELLYSWEKPLVLGFKATQETSECTAERMKAWGQFFLPQKKRRGLAGWRVWCLLTPFLPVSCSRPAAPE